MEQQFDAQTEVFTGEHHRLRSCAKCGGKMNLILVRVINDFDEEGHAFAAYCTKGLYECDVYQCAEHINDPDSAVNAYNRAQQKQFYDLHGIHNV